MYEKSLHRRRDFKQLMAEDDDDLKFIESLKPKNPEKSILKKQVNGTLVSNGVKEG